MMSTNCPMTNIRIYTSVKRRHRYCEVLNPAQCKGIPIPDSGKCLLVPKNSEENFACEIRNTAQGIRNPPTNDWNPESKFHRQKVESSTWNPESKAVLDSLTLGDESAFTVQLNHIILFPRLLPLNE